MDEKDILKKALIDPSKARAPRRKRVVHIRELEKTEESEGDSIQTSSDAIRKIARRQIKREAYKKKKAKLPLYKWKGTDFVRYFQNALRDYSVEIQCRGRSKDSLDMQSIYDSFVDRIDERMNNQVLIDYLDWWASRYGSDHSNRSIGIAWLNKDWVIESFLYNYFGTEAIAGSGKKKRVTKIQPVSETDASRIFELGGIPMSLMQTGIVLTHHIMVTRNEPNIGIRICEGLSKLSKVALTRCLEATRSNAPYPKEMHVDFIHLASDAMKRHDIQPFVNDDLGSFFKES